MIDFGKTLADQSCVKTGLVSRIPDMCRLFVTTQQSLKRPFFLTAEQTNICHPLHVQPKEASSCNPGGHVVYLVPI